ncbi:DUF6611 family protein [Gordonia sp. CPCC 205333]|uniref:DUF6611 family protein n=1 Tax=Gordonia sp. CPCC 205333 TaxID=3140790 RepID=UPI003AF35D48
MASYQWGSYTESDECYGLHRVHMVVFPPECSRNDRGWLRAWRAWPIVGIICGIVLFFVVAGHLATPLAVVVSIAIPLVLTIAMAVRVRGIRTRVAEVLTLAPPNTRYFAGGTAALLVAQRLIESSDQYRHGQLDASAYRRDWQRAYDYIGQ